MAQSDDWLLRDSVLRDNVATTGRGGALSIDNSDDGSVVDCNFWRNSAAQSHAGAIAATDAHHWLLDGTSLAECTAAQDGGALYLLTCDDWLLVDCTLANNSAQDNGGAVQLFSTQPR